MNRTYPSSIFAVVLLSAMPMWCQAPLESPTAFGDLSAAQLSQITESRQAAKKELAAQSAAFSTPSIAIPLGFHSYLIARAKITAVQLPNATTLRTTVSFHVEQLLRGESQITDFDVESRWAPKPETNGDGSISFNGAINQETALDLAEPKVGAQYILGYTLAYSSGKPVFAPGAIDTEDPAQSELISNMERFLALESEAGPFGFAPYLEALEGRVPWIRDIAVHRLSLSRACNASPVCTERFSFVVKRQLQSNSPNEREKAVEWLIWVDSVSRGKIMHEGNADGLPILPDSIIRTLLDAAIGDPNLMVGDRAFEAREMFETLRNGSPGDCFEIVPELRKAAYWRSPSCNVLPPGYPLVYTYGSVPPRDSSK